MIQEIANITFQNIAHSISFVIGLSGVIIICAGVIRALQFLVLHPKEAFPHCRLILGSHLVLGLDFFVGKDIIDTVLLPHGDIAYIDLATLIVVVTVRILMNHFLLKEIDEIKEEERSRIGHAQKKEA